MIGLSYFFVTIWGILPVKKITNITKIIDATSIMKCILTKARIIAVKICCTFLSLVNFSHHKLAK